MTGISVDFTLPDLVDTLAAGRAAARSARRSTRCATARRQGRRRASRRSAPAYLPLLEAAGPFDAAIDAAARDRRRRRADAAARRAARRSPQRLGGARRADARSDRAPRLRISELARLLDLRRWRARRDRARRQLHDRARGRDARKPAIGFSLYPDPLIDAGLGAPIERAPRCSCRSAPIRRWPRRCAPTAGGRSRRCEDGDTPEAQLCTRTCGCWKATALGDLSARACHVLQRS